MTALCCEKCYGRPLGNNPCRLNFVCSCHQAGTSESKPALVEEWEDTLFNMLTPEQHYSGEEIIPFVRTLTTQAKADGRREMRDEILASLPQSWMHYPSRGPRIDFSHFIEDIRKIINSKS